MNANKLQRSSNYPNSETEQNVQTGKRSYGKRVSAGRTANPRGEDAACVDQAQTGIKGAGSNPDPESQPSVLGTAPRQHPVTSIHSFIQAEGGRGHPCKQSDTWVPGCGPGAGGGRPGSGRQTDGRTGTFPLRKQRQPPPASSRLPAGRLRQALGRGAGEGGEPGGHGCLGAGQGSSH